MAELLLELFSEEIPARMQLPMAQNFKKAIEEQFKKNNLYSSSVKTFVTPRRLVLVADGLSLTQENTVIEKRGPRIDAPQQAIDGFLKSSGLQIEQLTKKTTDKGEFFFAITEQKGRATAQILKEVLENTLANFTWPKSMRWGGEEIKWVRPLKNIMAVFGADILNFSYGHLESNNLSEGHRFLSEGTFKVSNFKQYKDELSKRFVVLDSQERKKIILEESNGLIAEKHLKIVEDEKLLDEVVGLVEYPKMLMGAIDSSFMEVPEEVLISSIKNHQKYFCLRKEDSKLAPYFLVASNMKTDDDGAVIKSGNERVLRARLSDARFFWDQDRNAPLEARNEMLERVVFHAKLGTVAQKIERIKAIAKFSAMWIPHADLDSVERAAHLCKSDLVTEMVGEFPELQGVMGAYYAANDNENEDVVNALKEHYAPLSRLDKCPQNPVSVAIAISDKIDSLTGLFAINEKPTGSKDPFALRRAALGIIRIILENRLSIPLRILIEHSLKQYSNDLFKRPENIEGKIIKKKSRKQKTEIVEELLAFFEDRLKHLLKGENVRHDLITAGFNGTDEDDLLRIVRLVAALDKFLKTENGTNLLAAYKRAANILRIEEKKNNRTYKTVVHKNILHQNEEKTVYGMIQEIKPEIKAALKEDRFEDAMSLLSDLREPIDEFFDKVKVNDEQSDIRKNRLGILASMRELFDDIADFSVIEG